MGSRNRKRVPALSFGPLAGGAEVFGIAVTMTLEQQADPRLND
jgi:hypothetical protein